MQVIAPDMNPIWFYRTGETPDYSSYWPNQRNMNYGQKYFEGIYPVENIHDDWVDNYEMSLQFWLTTEGTEDLTIYKYSNGSFSSYATITPVEITPTGWTSYKVNRYDYTFVETGLYYIESSSAGIRSVKFQVHSALKFKQRLYKIEYYNSYNDYGMVFFDNSVQRFTGRTFFTGIWGKNDPFNNISAFEGDRGEIDKNRSTPVPVKKFTFSDIHGINERKINAILSCDYISVNDETFQNDAGPGISQIGKSDLINGQITFRLTNYDYTH